MWELRIVVNVFWIFYFFYSNLVNIEHFHSPSLFPRILGGLLLQMPPSFIVKHNVLVNAYIYIWR